MKSKHLLLLLLMAVFAPWAANAQQAIPYSYGFEDNNLATDGWTQQTSNYNSGIYSASSSSHGGTYLFRFNYGENPGYLISPLLTGTNNGVVLEFYYANYSSNYNEKFQVGYTTDENVTDPSAFTYGSEITCQTLAPSYTKYESSFPAGTKRIAIKYIYTNGYYLYLDDFSFTAPATCPKPTGLAVSNVTHNEATLSWTENGTATSWQLCINGDEDHPTTISTNPYTLTGLTPLTAYTVKVRSVGATENSAWSDEVSFNTSAVVEAVGDAWSDDFEGETCGWELVNGTLTNQWVWGTAVNNGGSHALYVSNDGGTTNYYNTSGTAKVFATKLLNFTDGKYTFSYDWKGTGESSYDFLRVALVPASQTLTAGTDHTTIGTTTLPTGWIALDGSNKLNQQSTWTNKEVTINVAAGNYYLVMAWRQDSSGGTNPPAAVDNVSITKIACDQDVTNLAVSNITTTSATLTWEGGEATQWQVAYGTASSFEGATEVIVDANTYDMAGLQSSSTYYVKVRAYCGGEDFGSWSDVLSFATACDVIDALGYEENFDDYSVASNYTAPSERVLPTCWNAINTTTYNTYKVFPTIYYYSSTNYANSTPNSLKFYSYAYYSSGTTTYDPQPQYAILPEMNDLAGKRITLWAKGYNASSTFKIGTMTDPADASTFVAITEQTLTTSYQQFKYDIPADAQGNYLAIMIDAATSSRTANGVYIDDLSIVEIPACEAPASFEISNITAHGCTITVTPASQLQENGPWAYYFTSEVIETPGLVNQGMVSVNPIVVNLPTTLSPSHQYYLWVGYWCADEETIYWVDQPQQLTTTEACPAPTALTATNLTGTTAQLNWTGTSDSYVVKYGEVAEEVTTYDFEDNTIPNDFTNSTTYAWTMTNANKHAGTYSIKSGGAGTAYASSDLTLTLNLTKPATISFWYLASSESGFDYGRFIVDGTQKLQTSGTTNSWAQHTSELAAGSHTLVWRYYKDSSGNNGDDCFYVDDITITSGEVNDWSEETASASPYTIENLRPETTYQAMVQGNCGDEGLSEWSSIISFTTLASCMPPTDLEASNITPNSATITWTPGGTETQWRVEYNLASVNDPFSGTTGHYQRIADEPTYTLTEQISAATSYVVRVIAICGEGDESEPSEVLTFTTPCDAIVTFPWTENFNSLTAGIPNCWDNSEGTTTTESYKWNYYASGHDGAGLRFDSYNNSSNLTNFLKTPTLSLPADKVMQLTFWYKNPTGGDFSVYISTDGGATHETALATGLTGVSSWTEHPAIYLADYAGQEVVIVFKGTSNYGSGDAYIYLDDVTVMEAPSCLKPTGLEASNITPNSAIITWTPGGTETQWRVEYNLASVNDPFSGTTGHYQRIANEPTYTLTEQISAATSYVVRVIAICGEGDESEPSEVLTFSTECEPYTITAAAPYTQDFEAPAVTTTYDQVGEMPVCWDNYPATSASAKILAAGATYNYASSGQVLYFYGSGNNYAVLPEFTNALNTLQISFKYATESSSNGTLTLGYITDEDENYNTFTAVEGGTFAASSASDDTFIDVDPIALSALPANATRLVFRWYYSSQWGCNVDDVEVSLLPSITKDITGYGTGTGNWYLIASPLADAVSPEAVGMMITDDNTESNNYTYDLYRFDQTQSDEWQNYRKNSFNLEPGKGYLYANKDDVTLTFAGLPYSGNSKVVTLSNNPGDNTTTQLAGYNLVGNPFTVNAYIGDRDFYVMNNGTEIILAGRAAEGEAEYIEPMEGIFVIATENNEQLTFTTTAPESKGASLALNVSKNRGVVDRAKVRFGEGRTLPKFQLRNNSTKVYIPQDNIDYAVVSAEAMGELPVSFRAEENGSYTLSFTSEEVSFSYLHLIDNMTGADVDLLQTPSYTFDALTTDYESRFKLVFATGNAADDNFAFYSNGNWIINNDGEATLQVIDVTGRILSSETVAGSVSKAIHAAPGVYMLRLVNGNNVKVQKVVVR